MEGAFTRKAAYPPLHHSLSQCLWHCQLPPRGSLCKEGGVPPLHYSLSQCLWHCQLPPRGSLCKEGGVPAAPLDSPPRITQERIRGIMLSYIGKRILMFIPTLIIISFLIFFIIQLPPGDYVTSYVAAMAAEGEIFTPEQIADLRVQYGLDDPWFVQYFNWVKGIVTEGDFGYSFEYGRDVWDVIMDRLYLTLAVSFIILIFQYGVSLPIGIYCANHQYSAGDYIWSFFGFIGTATPNFLLAIIIMYYIYVKTGNVYLGLFSTEMLANGMRWEYVPEFLGRCAIPLIVIGTSGTCGIIRTVRAQMLDEQARQYTLCARAKGCSEATITYKYCLRAALNPVVSGLAGSLRTIFSGSTVSAIVMNLAIQGPVLLAALKSQDMYLAGTTVLIQAVLVLVGTLLSDIALAWLDPRIRFAERG